MDAVNSDDNGPEQQADKLAHPSSPSGSGPSDMWEEIDVFLGSNSGGLDTYSPPSGNSPDQLTESAVAERASEDGSIPNIVSSDIEVFTNISDTGVLLNALDDSRRLISKLTRERDHFRMEFRRVKIDRDRLAADIKRLQHHYAKYGPTISLLKDKYETLMKEKTLLRIDRDRLLKLVPVKVDTGKETGSGTKVLKSEVKWSPWPRPIRLDPPEGVCAPDQLSLIRSVFVGASAVSTLAFENATQTMAAGSDDGSVSLFDADNQVVKLSGHKSFVSCVRFTSTYIVSSSGDGQVGFWTPAGECRSRFTDHKSCVWSVDVRDEYFVTGSLDQTMKLIDMQRGKCRHSFRGHVDSVNCVAFFDIGSSVSILSGSADKSMSLWDMRTSHCSFTCFAHPAAINSVVVGGSGLVVSSDCVGSIVFTDVRSFTRPLMVLNVGSCVNDLLPTAADSVVVASRVGPLRLVRPSGDVSDLAEPPKEILALTPACGTIAGSDTGGSIHFFSSSID